MSIQEGVFSQAISATFLRELNNRFRCEIKKDDEDNPILCYVPSSCHLSHFIDLTGKKVFVQENRNKKAKMQYSLLAVPYRNSYIALNESLANRAFAIDLHSSKFDYLGNRDNVKREYNMDGYKCDFWLPASNTVVEIKSIIATSKVGAFPNVKSTRMITQLEKMLQLLSCGVNVCYYIVSLHPYLNSIKLSGDAHYQKLFLACVAAGMKVYGCTTHFKHDGQLHIRKHIPVILGVQ